MRLFLAIDLPEPDKTALAGLQSVLTSGRQVAPDQMHITLAFLGNAVAHAEAEALHEALDIARLPKSAIHLEGLGHFGHDLPDAIWVAVKPTDALSPLHQKLARIARMTGLDLPRRRFVPHVTLARYARGDPSGLDDLSKLAARRPPFLRPSFDVIQVHLMQSHLRASGPEYETLASYPLV